MKNLPKLIVLFTITSMVWSCTSEKASKEETTSTTVLVFDVQNKAQLKAFDLLNLEETHKDLMNPQISGDEIDKVFMSWNDLHQSIGQFLYQEKFDWGLPRNQVKMYHRFYFDADGQVKYYIFRSLTPALSQETREAYAEKIQEFLRTKRIKLTRDEPFAQCGKTSFAG